MSGQKNYSVSYYLEADGDIASGTIYIMKIIIVPDGGSGSITIKEGGLNGDTKLYFKAHERSRVIDFRKSLKISETGSGNPYAEVSDCKVTFICEG